MAQTAIDYNAVERGASQTQGAAQRINQKQDRLQQMINRFTSEQFKTDQASGKLGETMSRFRTACQNQERAMEGIVTYLQGVIREYTEEDQQGAGRFNIGF